MRKTDRDDKGKTNNRVRFIRCPVPQVSSFFSSAFDDLFCSASAHHLIVSALGHFSDSVPA
jgi:hypothetical protein